MAMMNNTRGKRKRSAAACLTILLALCMGGSAWAATAATEQDRVRPTTFAYAHKVSEDGAWRSVNRSQSVAVGEIEMIELPLQVEGQVADGETLTLSIVSDSLDLKTAELVLFFEGSDSTMGKELNFSVDKNATLRAEISVDSLWRRDGVQPYLLLTAQRTQAGGTVTLEMKSKRIASLDKDAVLRIEGYAMRKQGASATTVEQPVGLSGVSSVDTAYVVYVGANEKVRIMVNGTQVAGLGISENGIVSGVEFDVDRRVYVSSITGKQILTRDEMQDIFQVLNFSFMKAPDESDWIARQDTYTYSRSMKF